MWGGQASAHAVGYGGQGSGALIQNGHNRVPYCLFTIVGSYDII